MRPLILLAVLVGACSPNIQSEVDSLEREVAELKAAQRDQLRFNEAQLQMNRDQQAINQNYARSFEAQLQINRTLLARLR